VVFELTMNELANANNLVLAAETEKTLASARDRCRARGVSEKDTEVALQDALNLENFQRMDNYGRAAITYFVDRTSGKDGEEPPPFTAPTLRDVAGSIGNSLVLVATAATHSTAVECAVCTEEEGTLMGGTRVVMVRLGCGHASTCEGCVSKLLDCPICRQPTGVIHRIGAVGVVKGESARTRQASALGQGGKAPVKTFANGAPTTAAVESTHGKKRKSEDPPAHPPAKRAATAVGGG
jgi:hypothetical protein